MGSYFNKIKMANKPKCMFCNAPLIAEDVSISNNVNTFYTLGKQKPVLAKCNQEIQLHLKCPNCGSHGEGAGDKFQYSVKSLAHEIIIDNVIVLRQSGPDLNYPLPANILDRKTFNPSRRDNE
jgi:hypothetical protein